MVYPSQIEFCHGLSITERILPNMSAEKIACKATNQLNKYPYFSLNVATSFVIAWLKSLFDC